MASRRRGPSGSLNVVREGRDWVIQGLASGPLHLYLHATYPESEWPEILTVKGAKDMHRALYDLWQTSDELEAEARRRTGKALGELHFHTPFGDFVTVSVDVVRVEDAEEARVAYMAQNERSARYGEAEKAALARLGFPPERMAEIHRQYGGAFKDWPKELSKAFSEAYFVASTEAHAAVHGPKSGNKRSSARGRR